MYSVFRNLAIIILSAKFFGLVARKFKAPQVVGEIIAGLIIGPCLLNLVHISDTISIFAEIGVVLLILHGPWHQPEGVDQGRPHRHPDRLCGRGGAAGRGHAPL